VPALLVRPSAVTPGVLVLTVKLAPEPVSELIRISSDTSSFATLLPLNVTVIVPIPAVITPTAVVTPLVPILDNPSSAESIASRNVLFVLLHEIGPVCRLLNDRINVPPVIVPAKVSV